MVPPIVTCCGLCFPSAHKTHTAFDMLVVFFFMNLRKISTEFDMEMEDPVKMKPIRRTKQSLPDQCKMKRTGFIRDLR